MTHAPLPRLRATLLAAGAALAFTAAASAEEHSTDHHSAVSEVIAEGLEHPWALAFLPDGRYLVTERNPGSIRIGDAEGGLSEPIGNVPEIFRYEGPLERSQGGLFDIKLHPDFAENQQVYISYSAPTDRGAAPTISRARLVEDADDGTASFEDVETIFQMAEDGQDSAGAHFGGRMAIDPDDGSIYLTIGDRRDMSRSQDADDQAGAIIRVTSDGEAHSGNSVDGDGYIHSYGHRNSQGLAFDADGQLWANEHGQLGGDMIQRIEGGLNYGWPMLSAGPDYSGAPLGVGTEYEGMETAFHYFDETVAPSGMVFYSGDAFPEWEGDQLHGALYGESIVRVRTSDGEVDEEEWMFTGIGRVRDIQIADDGAVWIVTDAEDGQVIRISSGD